MIWRMRWAHYITLGETESALWIVYSQNVDLTKACLISSGVYVIWELRPLRKEGLNLLSCYYAPRIHAILIGLIARTEFENL